MTYLPSGCIVTLLVLDKSGPLGVEGDLSVFPGGVGTVVGVVGVVGVFPGGVATVVGVVEVVGVFPVVGVPLPPTIVSVNITGLSVLVSSVHILHI